MTYQGHHGIFSISLEAFERSTDMVAPKAVENEPNPRVTAGAHYNEDTSERGKLYME
jgi:hypothetical protein